MKNKTQTKRRKKERAEGRFEVTEEDRNIEVTEEDPTKEKEIMK